MWEPMWWRSSPHTCQPGSWASMADGRPRPATTCGAGRASPGRCDGRSSCAERRHPRHRVAGLEAEALGEEHLAGLLVDGAYDDVSQLARAHSALAQHTVGPLVRPSDPSG